jgi:hypothetical protein
VAGDVDVLILWGSETGTAQGLAEMTESKLKDTTGLSARAVHKGPQANHIRGTLLHHNAVPVGQGVNGQRIPGGRNELPLQKRGSLPDWLSIHRRQRRRQQGADRKTRRGGLKVRLNYRGNR